MNKKQHLFSINRLSIVKYVETGQIAQSVVQSVMFQGEVMAYFTSLKGLG